MPTDALADDVLSRLCPFRIIDIGTVGGGEYKGGGLYISSKEGRRGEEESNRMKKERKRVSRAIGTWGWCWSLSLFFAVPLFFFYNPFLYFRRHPTLLIDLARVAGIGSSGKEEEAERHSRLLLRFSFWSHLRDIRWPSVGCHTPSPLAVKGKRVKDDVDILYFACASLFNRILAIGY